MKSPRAQFANRFSALLVSGAIVAAGWPAEAQADKSSDATIDMLTAMGLGDKNTLTAAIADAGKSLCPQLVKPGASLATTAPQLQGNSGLAPQIAGIVAGLAIQMECPALMASIANGDLPKLLSKNAASGPPALPFPMPGGKH